MKRDYSEFDARVRARARRKRIDAWMQAGWGFCEGLLMFVMLVAWIYAVSLIGNWVIGQ